MSISDKIIQQLKKATKEQLENELWRQIRLGRLIVSNPHNIYTKMNSVLKSFGPIKSTTPLVPQVILGGPCLKTQATT